MKAFNAAGSVQSRTTELFRDRLSMHTSRCDLVGNQEVLRQGGQQLYPRVSMTHSLLFHHISPTSKISTRLPLYHHLSRLPLASTRASSSSSSSSSPKIRPYAPSTKPPQRPAPVEARKQQRPIPVEDIRKTADYKARSRRITALMVAIPFFLVTSYLLLKRGFAAGEERKEQGEGEGDGRAITSSA